MGEGAQVGMKVHEGPMESPQFAQGTDREQAARLAAACDELEAALEAADLSDDSPFADALVEAVAATHSAYELASETETGDQS